MATELPKLVVLDLYRNALTTVERMSRKDRDKKLHAWAMKAKEEVSQCMVQIAKDEMYGEIELTEEEKEAQAESSFYH